MGSFPIFAHLGPAVRYRISRRGSSGVWNQLHGNLVALSDTRRCPVTIQRPVSLVGEVLDRLHASSQCSVSVLYQSSELECYKTL